MDSDFIPRVFVNGAALGRSVGKVVSIILKPNAAVTGTTWFKADTTDGRNVRINLSEPLNVGLNDWVEVIGIPTSDENIKCQEIITFTKEGDDFATRSYDVLVGMLANCPDFYNFGE